MRLRARTLTALAVSAALLLVAAPAQAADPIDPSIEGTVTTATNSPIGGVAITATQGAAVVASTTTDSAGHYAFDIADGTYSLTFTPPTAALSSAKAVFVEAPRNWPLDVVLTAPTPGRVSLTGDVTLDGGTPLGNGYALFAGSGNASGPDGYFRVMQPAGTSGQWSFRGTANTSNTSTLFVMASGGPTQTMLQDTDTQLTIPVTTSTVTVTTTAGDPAAGAKVRLNVGGYGNADGSLPVFAGAAPFLGTWTASGVTDASGNLTIIRPVMTAAVTGSLIIDSATPTVLRSSFTSVSIPTAGGSFAQALEPVSVSAPAPGPTVTVVATLANGSTPTPNATPTAAPSQSATPSTTPAAMPTPTPSVTGSGTVTFSDGTPMGYAVVIPIDRNQRVNGGNSADANGRYSVIKPLGFSGVWTVTTRPQTSLAVKDPLYLHLEGSTVHTWNGNVTQDFVLPTTLYRLRATDSAGNPIQHAKISIAVRDDTVATSASVAVVPGDAPMTGYWSGNAFTGADGWAQVPGIRMLNTVPVTINVNTDPEIRLLPATVTVSSKDLAETVIALSAPQPVISAVAPTTAIAGGSLTVTGTGFLGATAVTIGGVRASFTVISDTQVNVTVPSDAITGAVVITTPAGNISSSTVTVSYPPMSIATTSLPAGQVAQSYAAQLTASGGLAPYAWRRVSGSLPSGVRLSLDGSLTGTPTNATATTSTYRVTDARGASITRALSIQVAPRPQTAPGVIESARGTEGSGRISLAWAMPLSNGGNRITGFQVQRSLDGTTWSTLIANTGSASLGTSFVSTVGQRAKYRVAAVNLSGVGAYGPASQTDWLSAFGPASGPQNVTASAVGSTVTVSWAAPADNGGRAITGYRVRTSNNGVNWTTRIIDSKTSVRTAKFAMTNPRGSFVQVAAITLGGVGGWSATTPIL